MNMRSVPNPTQQNSLLSEAVLPNDILNQSHNLSKRFPDAGLSPVVLLRVPRWDRLLESRGRCRVWLAMECFQVTGSFKVRGALLALAAVKKEGIRTVIAASAGNHGAGIAHAATVLGMEASLVVPEGTPERKLRMMRRPCVKIETVPGGYDCAEARARMMAKQLQAPFISPYDREHVVAGNGGSLGFEIVAALGRVPTWVVVPMGGGGLATGLAWALGREAGETPWPKRRVWGTQSEVSAAFALSLERGEAVESLEPKGFTLAEGLEGGISRLGFSRAAAVVAGVFVVTERQIEAAMATIWHDLGVRVEGSAAAALAPLFTGNMQLEGEEDLVIVLTGRNVDDETFDRVVGGLRPC